MKFYIASKLENYRDVRSLAARLINSGNVWTYDWTTHGSIKSEGAARLCEVGGNELRGVIAADVVIVIFPGGKGTHVELGIALGTGKKLFLCAYDDKYFRFDDNTTTFYWCCGVKQIIGNNDTWFDEILKNS